MRGLYIHIPFCVKKCSYCDFYSLPARMDSMESYVEAMIQEAGLYSGMTFDTLYIGGGTPSLLKAKHLKILMDGIRKVFDISGVVEATIEVNPESATHEFLEAVKDTGFNRVSFGVQSLSDYELKSVGRIHTAEQAVEAIKLAKKLGFEAISADLIIGLPGQTWTSLRKSLNTLVKLGVQHLSVYCLSLEEGTFLKNNPPADLPTDDMQAKLFEEMEKLLNTCGYAHYEISNFAMKGYECQHNLNYWRGGEYLGLGAAAASHLEGKRFKNKADLDAYIWNPAGQIEGVEELGKEEKAAEETMLRLRLLEEGVDIIELAERFGGERVEGIVRRLEGMAEEGLLVTVHQSVEDSLSTTLRRRNENGGRMTRSASLSASNGVRYCLSPERVLTCNPIMARVISG
jgi:oxygen-independent coproporphyrinogen-3 oxidase